MIVITADIVSRFQSPARPSIRAAKKHKVMEKAASLSTHILNVQHMSTGLGDRNRYTMKI